MGNIGVWEIALIVLVLLLVFGPKRLPGVGRSLGRGMREFKETVTDTSREIKEATVDTPGAFKEALNPMAPTKTDEAPAAEPVAEAPAAATAPAQAPAAAPSPAPAPEPEVVAVTAGDPAADSQVEPEKPE